MEVAGLAGGAYTWRPEGVAPVEVAGGGLRRQRVKTVAGCYVALSIVAVVVAVLFVPLVGLESVMKWVLLLLRLVMIRQRRCLVLVVLMLLLLLLRVVVVFLLSSEALAASAAKPVGCYIAHASRAPSGLRSR